MGRRNERKESELLTPRVKQFIGMQKKVMLVICPRIGNAEPTTTCLDAFGFPITSCGIQVKRCAQSEMFQTDQFSN